MNKTNVDLLDRTKIKELGIRYLFFLYLSEVKDFGPKGRGIVASKPFKKGEFVVEYAGDLIDTGIAKERENKYCNDMTAGCYMYYFKHKGKQYW